MNVKMCSTYNGDIDIFIVTSEDQETIDIGDLDIHEEDPLQETKAITGQNFDDAYPVNM